MSETDMDNQVQESISTPETIDTKKLTWIIIVGLVIVLCVYFYVVFLTTSRDAGVDPVNQTETISLDEKGGDNVVTEPSNDEFTTETPKKFWLVEGMNTDILNTRISNEYGRILAHPEWGAPLYISTASCTVDCLETWLPYEVSQEMTDGDISTIYREDTGNYQYTWKGEALYMYRLDDPIHMFQGMSSDGSWQFARP